MPHRGITKDNKQPRCNGHENRHATHLRRIAKRAKVLKNELATRCFKDQTANATLSHIPSCHMRSILLHSLNQPKNQRNLDLYLARSSRLITCADDKASVSTQADQYMKQDWPAKHGWDHGGLVDLQGHKRAIGP